VDNCRIIKIWGVQVWLSAFLTLALNGGEWSASRFCCFTLGTIWSGGWVGPNAGMDSGGEFQNKYNSENMNYIEIRPSIVTSTVDWRNQDEAQNTLVVLCIDTEISVFGHVRSQAILT
jgi:hypothetical protein